MDHCCVPSDHEKASKDFSITYQFDLIGDSRTGMGEDGVMNHSILSVVKVCIDCYGLSPNWKNYFV